MVDQVFPPSLDLSIMYPETSGPGDDGGFQLRSICDEEIVVTINPVSCNGAISQVVAEVIDGRLVPTEFMADTRYV